MMPLRSAELGASGQSGGSVSVPINIPKLGVSMTEGTLVEWLVTDGDQVSVGQPLYVIETDKVENEVEANAEGIIRMSGEAGETYAVGESIGQIET
jgi:pyruvate/2-oxoglutarate dehydrogenase complex dihydrolipoamide acyltransferase (E2) component